MPFREVLTTLMLVRILLFVGLVPWWPTYTWRCRATTVLNSIEHTVHKEYLTVLSSVLFSFYLLRDGYSKWHYE